MKKIKLTFVLLTSAIFLISCKDEKQEKAEKSLDVYTAYVDSVSKITEEEAHENWEIIESDYAKLKTDAEASLAEASDKTKLQADLIDSETKYDEFKSNVIAEKEKTVANTTNDAKIEKYKVGLAPLMFMMI
jgi:hypothetical protein